MQSTRATASFHLASENLEKNNKVMARNILQLSIHTYFTFIYFIAKQSFHFNNAAYTSTDQQTINAITNLQLFTNILLMIS